MVLKYQELNIIFKIQRNIYAFFTIDQSGNVLFVTWPFALILLPNSWGHHSWIRSQRRVFFYFIDRNEGTEYYGLKNSTIFPL